MVSQWSVLDCLKRSQTLLLLTEGTFGFPVVDLATQIRVGALLGDDVEGDPENGADDQDRDDYDNGNDAATKAVT